MAFCFSGSLLRANFNIVFPCLILLLLVANKFLLLLLLPGNSRRNFKTAGFPANGTKYLLKIDSLEVETAYFGDNHDRQSIKHYFSAPKIWPESWST